MYDSSRLQGTGYGSIADGKNDLAREGFSEDPVMLHYALVFLIIAIIAAVFGFGGIAGAAAGIAKALCLVFLVFAVIAFVRRAT